jgi:glycosyltransferase involved in cell wall biosynthesis
MTIRLAYLATHPIQYQAPLLRRIAQERDLDLTVFFCSDLSTRPHAEPDFGQSVNWDRPLLGGYRHEFLPALGSTDVVSFWRPWNYGLLPRLRRGRFDVLWIHGPIRWLSWVAMAWAKAAGVKVLVRDDVTLLRRQRGPVRRAIKAAVWSYLKAVCDGYLAVGTRNRQYYRHYGIEDGRIFLMPYAVDNQFFQSRAAAARTTREELRASLGLEPGRPVVLFAGKMIPLKRTADLLEAYIRLSPDGQSEPRPYLLFVGDGAERPALEARAAQLPWSSIRFLGFKNQSELPRWFDLCDVFVLPSVNESFGLVVNEAMNAGRAIIVSGETGCGPDLVRDGENGFVFQARDVEDLRRVLAGVLSDPQRCAAMGRKSLEIINGWGYEQNVAALRQAIECVTQDGSGAWRGDGRPANGVEQQSMAGTSASQTFSK